MKARIGVSYSVWLPLQDDKGQYIRPEDIPAIVNVTTDLLNMIDMPDPVGLAVVDQVFLVLTFERQDEAEKVMAVVATPHGLTKAAIQHILDADKWGTKTQPDDIPF